MRLPPYYIRKIQFMRPIFTLAMIFVCVNLSSQTIKWQKSFGGSAEDYAACVQQTTDDGFIIVGSTASTDGKVKDHHGLGSYNYDFWILKVNGKGIMLWQKTLGGSGDDVATAVQQTTDGGFIVAGYSESTDGDVTGNNGCYDFWVVKLTSSGSIQWQKSFGGKRYDYAKSVRQTSDGGYIVAGYTNSNNADVSGNHGNDDYWVIKLNSTGSITWKQCFGGSDYDQASSVRQTKDGGYILSGYSRSQDGQLTDNKGGYDYWIIKLNSAGTLSWQTNLGGNSDDLAYAVEQTTDGGYIIGGYTYSSTGQVQENHGGADYWIVKLNSSGQTTWKKTYGGSANDFAYSIAQTVEGGYVINGYTASSDSDLSHNSGYNDYWIVKIGDTGMMQWQKDYGATNNEIAYGVQQLADGGFVMSGSSDSNSGKVKNNHGDYDYWIVRLNPVKIFITTSSGTEICAGTKVTCTAQLTDGSIASVYTWKKNGTTVGNGQRYSDTALKNGDTLSCQYEVGDTKYYSNRLVFSVSEKAVPVVTVTTSTGLSVCSGTPVTFTASSQWEGTDPIYRWYKDDVYTGVKKAVYTDASLKNGDTVWTVLTTNASCLTTNSVISKKLKFNVTDEVPKKPGDITGPVLVTPLQQNVAYSVKPEPWTTYTWDVPKGSKIVSGNGTASIKVNWGNEGGKVRVAAVNGCGPSEKKRKLVVGILVSSVREIASSAADSRENATIFSAQPNPVKDIVTVQFTSVTSDKYSLQVRDISGKLILQKAGVSILGLNQVKFNLGSYSQGIYLITLLTEQDKKVIKVIKE